MSKTNKRYVKLVIESTLATKMPLAEISTMWFGNSGRLFQPQILKAITNAQKSGVFEIGKKRSYKTNIAKLLESIDLGDSSLSGKYKNEMKKFYLNLGEYTQQVYLSLEVVKALTDFERERGTDFDLAVLVQLPFVLRYFEEKDPLLMQVFIRLMKLEEYVEVIQKLEKRYIYILEENQLVDSWVESYEKLIKLLPKLGKKGVPLFKMNTQKIKAFGK